MNLSIIIPVYNVEKYLPQCLDSVFSQNLDNCEVICVNDGSPDDSRKILADYQKKYTDMVIVDRENGGLSAARNSGLEVAQGEYIYFLDSDDYLLDGALAKALAFAAGQSLDMACFNAKIGEELFYFEVKTQIKSNLPGKLFHSSFYQANGFFPPSAVWMYIYKRSFLNDYQLRFMEGVLHEDEDFTLKAFYLAEKVAVMEDLSILFHRVLREGSITASISLKDLHDLIDNAERAFTFLESQNNSNTSNIGTFYLRIFGIYRYVMQQVLENFSKSKKNVFQVKDYIIVKRCANHWEWYVYYFLFRYNLHLYGWYTSKKSNRTIKKILNRIFRILYKLI